jgi:prolyl-tRNA synthetase
MPLFHSRCGGTDTIFHTGALHCVGRASALGHRPQTAIFKDASLRLSRAFLPVLKESPSDAQIVSHKLMLRAGLIRQTAAGIYAWLPLGFRVLKKIEQIVREEQDRAGAQEILMPTIQSADLWRESGRYDAYGPEMLRIRDRHDREMLSGPTNEEMLTAIVRDEFKSYRDLPRMLYHIQWKFRDEVRPRFGVMRGREFLMKDAYSFDLDEAGARLSYYTQLLAYLRTFSRMGIRAVPMKAASGPIGGDLSHEFIVLAPTGESEVFYDAAFDDMDWSRTDVAFGDAVALHNLFSDVSSTYAATDETHDEDRWAEISEERRRTGRGIEVGHIFYFGDKYSAPMGLKVSGPDGQMVTPMMGSYGIGVSRLVGAIIEASHDDAGIVWPEAVAPWKVGLVTMRQDDDATVAAAEDLYGKLKRIGIEVLYDDRDERGGVKLGTMDLIGLPWQVIIGPRDIANGVVELKNRASGEKEELSLESALARLAA